MKTSLVRTDLLRFLAVTVAGLAIDLGMGWGLATLAQVPLVLAAVIGFLAAALFNYVLHEFWTFRTADSDLSLKRATAYVAAALMTLAVRVSVVAALDRATDGRGWPLAILIASCGVSFVFSYLVSRRFVYRRSPEL